MQMNYEMFILSVYLTLEILLCTLGAVFSSCESWYFLLFVDVYFLARYTLICSSANNYTSVIIALCPELIKVIIIFKQNNIMPYLPQRIPMSCWIRLPNIFPIIMSACLYFMYFASHGQTCGVLFGMSLQNLAILMPLVCECLISWCLALEWHQDVFLLHAQCSWD